MFIICHFKQADNLCVICEVSILQHVNRAQNAALPIKIQLHDASRGINSSLVYDICCQHRLHNQEFKSDNEALVPSKWEAIDKKHRSCLCMSNTVLQLLCSNQKEN
jgi:hypothetical protein